MISAGHNVFANRLLSGLSRIQGVDAQAVVAASATGLRGLITKLDDLQAALEVHDDALVAAFRVAPFMACLSTVGATGMEREAVKKATSSDAIERGKG